MQVGVCSGMLIFDRVSVGFLKQSRLLRAVLALLARSALSCDGPNCYIPRPFAAGFSPGD